MKKEEIKTKQILTRASSQKTSCKLPNQSSFQREREREKKGEREREGVREREGERERERRRKRKSEG